MLQKLFKSLFVPKFFLSWATLAVCSGYCLSLIILVYALTVGLSVPADETQGDVFRIIYVHVPIAALSLSIYFSMVMFVLLERLLHLKMADTYALSCGFVGVLMTALALMTGSIWAKPTWGAWWIWDARITSEVILLLLYFAYLLSRLCIRPAALAIEVSSWVAIIGLLDLPLVHYSVQWWYTLHQGPTVFQLAAPKMPWIMLYPLLLSGVGFICLSASMVLHTSIVIRSLCRASRLFADGSSKQVLPCHES